MEKMLDLSRIMHNRIWSDVDESLCSRAWRYRTTSTLAAVWVVVFTPDHCRRSFYWHHFKKYQVLLDNHSRIA
jgi:hypothetical protein